MPGNNFEKQVHTIMDEFKLNPSAGVWPKVKNRIAKRKRRRFFFYLLPITAALLVGGFYIVNEFARGTNSNQSTMLTAPVTTVDKPGAATNATGKQNNTPASDSQQPGEPENVNGHPVTLREKDYDAKITGKKNTDENSTINPNGSQSMVTGSGQVTKLIPATGTKPAATGMDDVAGAFFPSAVAGSSLVRARFIEEMPLMPMPGTGILNSSLSPNVMKGNWQVPDPAIAGVKKIQWNIHASGGISKTSNGHITNVFSSEEKADLANAPNPGGGAGGPATMMQYPRSGKSFSVGIAAQKNLSPRSSLLAGIQYFYASDAIKAGQYRDTVLSLQNAFSSRANGYYVGNSSWFTNRYHFLELPVSYQYLANRHKKIPVRLQASFSYSYLLSTNALVYDSANGGIYFSDAKQFNRSSFHVSSAVLFQLAGSKKMSWSIGPQFRSSLSPLRKSEFDPNKFLSSGSIRMNIQLH